MAQIKVTAEPVKQLSQAVDDAEFRAYAKSLASDDSPQALIAAFKKWNEIAEVSPEPEQIGFLKAILSAPEFQSLPVEAQTRFAQQYISPKYDTEKYNGLRFKLGLTPLNITGKPAPAVETGFTNPTARAVFGNIQPDELKTAGLAIVPGVAGAAVGMYSGSAPAGLLTGNLVESGMREAMGVPAREGLFSGAISSATGLTPESSGGAAINFAANTVEDEIAGRALLFAARKAYGAGKATEEYGKAAVGKLGGVPTVNRAVNLLETTAGGYLGGLRGAVVNKWESIFAPFARQAATERFAHNMEQEITRISNTELGPVLQRRMSLLSENLYEQLPEEIKATISKNEFASRAQSTLLGEQLKKNVPTIPIPVFKTVQPQGVVPFGQRVAPSIQAGTVDIKGPMNPKKTRQFIANSEEKLRNLLPVGDQNPRAREVFNAITAMADPANDTRGIIPFDKLWEWKKQLGQFLKFTDLDPRANELLRKLRGVLDEDIKYGLSILPGAQKSNYLAQFEKINDIVIRRHDVFDPPGTPESILTKMRKYRPMSQNSEISPNETLPSFIEGAIANPTELKRMLLAGDIDFLVDPSVPVQFSLYGSPAPTSKALVPFGTPPGIVKVSNTRQDLATFKLAKMLDDAKIVSQSGQNVFDSKKLKASWDAFKKSESANLLYSKETQENLDSMFTAALDYPAKNPSQGVSAYLLTRLGTQAAGMAGAAVLGGSLGGSLAQSLMGPSAKYAAGGAAVLGAWALARLAIKKDTAPIVAAMITGRALPVPVETAVKMLKMELRGLNIDIQDKDGKIISGRVNAKGEFEANLAALATVNTPTNQTVQARITELSKAPLKKPEPKPFKAPAKTAAPAKGSWLDTFIETQLPTPFRR